MFKKFLAGLGIDGAKVNFEIDSDHDSTGIGLDQLFWFGKNPSNSLKIGNSN